MSARPPPLGDAGLAGALDPGFAACHIVLRRRNGEAIVLLGADAIRHCFVDNAANYRQASVRKRLMEPVLGESILTGEGDMSLRLRRALAPLFNRPALDASAGIMAELTRAAVERLGEGVFPGIRLAAELTLANLSATLLSGAFADRAGAVIDALDDICASMEALPLSGAESGVGYLPRIDRPARAAAARRLRAIVREELLRRAGRPRAEGDLIDRLVAARAAAAPEESAATDGEGVVDDVVTFLIAGHETTATIIAFCLDLLARHPDALDRAIEEVDGLAAEPSPPGRWAERLPFLLACVEETQRLFPPVPVLTRQAIADDVAGDAVIPAGALVVLPVRLLHRLPRFWQAPDAFRPERFLADNRRSVGRYSFLPFGLGPRMCIGAAFGNREAVIVLALLLRRFRPRAVGPAGPTPLLRVVLRADNGAPVELSRRPEARMGRTASAPLAG